MVGVVRRMNKLSELVNIRVGPGAAILPKDVTRIHLEFAHKLNDGHMGPRKFWREALPRLKYWNPAVPMIVNRTVDQQGPAKLSLYLREPGATLRSDIQQLSSAADGFSKAPTPAEGERVVTIDMKHRRSEAILQEFMKKSGAVAVEPTPQDEAQLSEVKELKSRSNIDRARVKKMIDAQKREKAMIAAAHSEAAAIRAEL
ncbi:Ribosomal protein/NADH dehydrogenase domain-containing protein [Madurella fahalii]|uniref:Ribosomal protein/NADH dehydrogenase domain-containing protein n=1 Tax=Madurella fahalii TaxID=1157608 RepID=A0ABQ0G5I6_9PEZI